MIKIKKLNQIKFGAILSYLSIGINILAGLLYTPWMIQQIGKSDYGLYTLANSLITLFLVDFGFSAATSRYVSKYLAEGRPDKANNFLGMIYKLYLIVDVVIFCALIIVFFFIDSIYTKLTPSEIEKFKVVYAIASIYALINFPFVTLNGILTSCEKFVHLKLAEIIHRVLMVVLTVLALKFGMGLYALVLVNAVSGLVVILYKYIVIQKQTTIKANFKYNDKSLYLSIFKFSFWTTITILAQRLVFNITPSILGITVNSAAIAVFGIISTIEAYAYTFTSAINGMFMPKISRIYLSNGEDGNIMPLMIKVGRFQFVLNGLIVAGFAVAGKQFINLWMGSGYSKAYIGILLVVIPGLFYNSLEIANVAMVVKNKVKQQALISVVTGVLNIICSFILSKLFGVVGAALSIFVAYMVRAILCHIVYKKHIGIDIKSFAKNCYLKTAPAICFTILIGTILNAVLPDGGWVNLFIKVILLLLVYAAFSFGFSLYNNEREKMFAILKQKIKK